MRRTSLLLLLLAWLPALAGAPADARHAPDRPLPVLAIHAIGDTQPARTSHADATPVATISIEGGPAPATGAAPRPVARPVRADVAAVGATARRTADLRRLDWLRALERAHTGFLTVSPSTAPPRG